MSLYEEAGDELDELNGLEKALGMNSIGLDDSHEQEAIVRSMKAYASNSEGLVAPRGHKGMYSSSTMEEDRQRASDEYDLAAQARARFLRRKQTLDDEYDRARKAAEESIQKEERATRDQIGKIKALEAQLSTLLGKTEEAENQLEKLETQARKADGSTQKEVGALKAEIADVEAETARVEGRIESQEAELDRLRQIVEMRAVEQREAHTRTREPPAHAGQQSAVSDEYRAVLATLPFPSAEDLARAIEDDARHYCMGRETVVKNTNDRTGIKYDSGARSVRFSNNTVKHILPDGTEDVQFYNGDLKRTMPDGIQVYLYADVGTLMTTMPDGVEVYRFKAGQVEKHLTNGQVEIIDVTGEKKIVTK
ncbi:T-complex protein 10 C-terminus [Carpediemonas membranifera]|uniref:T-complex protein 10 C-terminus n=1 Tax=Carpediemonas membranifera TaxID=201153 RepID=A0A8J6E165_9EUKA|nr:T-complex protein 10 C-terminus [Carpediemonas membranifera]|eukprot:KAG9395949.1 T-complex protein 10 C-terminus [Carpediemonas membranifera]